jgi:hypothetical protein
MFATLRRLAEQSSDHLTHVESPYPLRKVWPPDFTKLPPQSQFRFEKKYKRRLALKAARPRWDKAVKLTQYASITSTALSFHGIPGLLADPEQSSSSTCASTSSSSSADRTGQWMR